MEWTPECQRAFEILKTLLCSAPILSMPTEDGRFFLDTDASEVAIAAILQQEQEINGSKKLRVIAYGSRILSDAEMKYGAPKAEMLAVVYFLEKFRSHLAGRQFTLRVDNQALSWLKTYSMDNGLIGRWIARLGQYDMKIVHRPREKHTNADGLSKKSEFYRLREERRSCQGEVREGLSFLDQETYDALPLVRWIDKTGNAIPDHPETPTMRVVKALTWSSREKESIQIPDGEAHTQHTRARRRGANV